MTYQYHITTNCTVRNQQVLKDDVVLYSYLPKEDAYDVPAFLQAAYKHIEMNYPKFYKMDNLSKLALLAVEFLLKENDIHKRHDASKIGVILSNRNASLDSDIKYFESLKSIASPSLFVYTLPNIMTGEICIKHKFKGENAFFVSDETNENFIHQYVTGLFQNDIIDACICGWVEVLGDKLEAMLMLVEKKKEGSWNIENQHAFTIENIKKIYALNDGKVNV